MKKILLSCVTCLLALGLVTACDDETEEPEEPEVPGTVVDEGGGTTYLLGVEVDGVLSYIDGGTVEGYAYEGTLTTDVSKAAAISCESSGSTYYLSFDNSGVTNWVTIAQVVSESDQKTHTNLVYATEKSALYLHTTDGGAEYFGNEDGSYFLCYNSAFECFYASSITGTPSNSNVPYIQSSPVAGLYTTDGKLVAGGVGEEPAPAIEPVLGTVTEGEYFLGVTLNGVPYYFDGQVYSNYYAEVTSDGWDAVVVTVAAVTGGYTLSFTDEDEATQYLNMTENNSNRNLKWGTESFVWSYDSTYSVFVAQDSEGEWYFIGTYGSYVELALNAYGYLTGDKSSSYTQYPSELFTVITYNAPESVTISGAEESQSLEEGETLQLTATVSGGDEPLNGKIVWESSNEEAATVSSTGLVKAVAAYDSVTITATSAVNASATASVTLAITAKAQGPVIADWQNSYESGATYKLAFTYNNSLHYVTGLDAGDNYTYEGLTSTSFVVGADISVAKVESGADNEYYLTYTFDEKTYYITITTDDYKGLSFTTTKSSIFYNATYNCWCNSALSYYLGAYYVSSTNYVWLEATDISKIAGTSTLPAELYKWTGEDYGDYEIVDFDTMSSTGVTDSSNDSYTTLVGTTLETLDTCKITWDSGSGNNSFNTRVNSNHYIQVYSGESITLELKDGYAITRIELACSASSAQTFSVAIDSGEASTEGTTVEGDLVTITGIEEATSMVLKNTSTSQSRITDIVFYYTYTEA